VTVHPRVGRTTRRRPDFCARSHSENFLIECVLATNKSTADNAATKRLNQAYDALNQLSSPDYFVWLSVSGTPRTPVPGRLFRAFVSSFLKGLVYEDITRAAEAADDLQGLPRTNYHHDGCTITVAPIPKAAHARGTPGSRPIGIVGDGEARWVDARTPVRDAIRAKATRYGRPRRAYVLAVNAVDERLYKIDIMQALFGRETFLLGRNVARQPKMVRQPNGAWFGPKGPMNRRVSSVLVVSQLHPWTVAAHTPAVYMNPFAIYACPPGLLKLPSHRPVKDRLEARKGQNAQTLFQLPPGWPSVPMTV
ncbi:MAG: hypothetical protein ACREA0_07705, partial [bacterium]